MNTHKIIEELKTKYPDKKIIETSGEMICEVEPTFVHPEYSVAIAVIDKTIPHYHSKGEEVYRVVKGTLSLFVDGAEHKLNEGDQVEVKPGQVHYAEGNATWVECVSRPGWAVEDHILVASELERSTIFSKGLYNSGTPREEIVEEMRIKGFKPALISDKPGFIYELHQHEETKLLVCLEGSMRVVVSGEDFLFEPGDLLEIPSNVPHSAVVGENGCVFYWSEKKI